MSRALRKNQRDRIYIGLLFLVLSTMRSPVAAGGALRINGISPDHGGRNENTELTINGEGFTSQVKVSIWGGGPYLKGSYATKGQANALDCSGSYAYLACGLNGDPNSQGVQIINIQDPNNPLSVHFFSLPKEANDIHIIGNYAYVAASEAGLYILNVQDPVDPVLVSSLALPGKAVKLSLYGTYAYIAANYEGLHIINISDPNSPQLEGTYPEFAKDVIVEGNYAYLAGGDPGDPSDPELKIIDIHDPNDPTLFTSYATLGKVYSVYKRFNYLYLAKKSYGVEILDVSEADAPNRVSNITGLDKALQVFVKGNYLYVADGDGGIKIFSHNPAQCTLVGFHKMFGSVEDLQVSDNTIFIANKAGELQILDAKSPRNPSIASIEDLKGSSGPNIAGLHLQGNYLYVYSEEGQNWLKILDIVDPQNILVLGTTYEIGSNPKDLTARPGFAYLVGEDGLKVFDIDSSGDPSRITNFTPYISDYINKITEGSGIFMKENMLFLAASLEKSNVSVPALIVFSLDTYPGDPYPVNDIDMDPNYPIEAVSALGDHLMLAKGRGGMEIYTIQDSSQPGRISGLTFNNSNIKDILISGDYTFLADETEDMMHGLVRTVKSIDPTDPDLRNSYVTRGKPQSLTLSENFLYLAEGQAGVEIIDVEQPENPLLVASLPTLTSAVEIVSDGADHIYLAMENGIMALRALKPCPENPVFINETALTVKTPKGLAEGTYNVSVAGPDGSLAVFPNGFTVVENRPPVFIEPLFTPIMFLSEGDDFTFPIIASDPDGDELVYDVSISRLPGAELVGNVFSWAPIEGYYEDILFTVDDGEFIAEQKVTIIVEEEDPSAINHPPELFVPSSLQSGTVGVLMTFRVEVSDPDPEDVSTLEISMLNAPSGAQLQPLGIQADKKTAYFLLTPTDQQAGDHTITFKARDRHSSEDQEFVSIHIQEVSGSPQVEFQAGFNFWLCPAGRSDYSSFDFLRELGEDTICSLKAYNWDLTLLYSSYWFFGEPCGSNFFMDQSWLYVVSVKTDVPPFTWPLN